MYVYICTHMCISVCIFLSPELNSSGKERLLCGCPLGARGAELADKRRQKGACALAGTMIEAFLLDQTPGCVEPLVNHFPLLYLEEVF